MKKELRRIEAMLAQLADQPYPKPVAAGWSTATTQAVRTERVVQVPSFDVNRHLQSQPLPCHHALPPLVGEPSYTDDSTMPPLLISPTLKTNQPALSTAKALTLPPLQVSNLTNNHPLATKPVLAVERLKAIAAVAVEWQDELQQLLHQIQALYAEGPLVDGWLEPDATNDSVAPTLRRPTKHPVRDASGSGESEQLSDRPAKQTDAATLNETTASYRLCGFNADGQLWFRHCPSEQVAAVSLAISRYERLKHYLTRKQHLETELDKLAEALASLHKYMQAEHDH